MAESGSLLLLPSLIWTGESEVVRRGIGLLVQDGKVVDLVQPNARVPLGTTRVELPGKLLTPGLTNFHVHLELSNISRPAYPGTFLAWLGMVMSRGPKTEREAASAATEGARESISFGVTGAVDITRFPAATREALAKTGMRVRSCGEVTGLAGRHMQGLAMQCAAADNSGLEGSLVTPGVSPHAPYSTGSEWYAACAAEARAGLTLTTHLAETPEEREFLAHHAGPFRDLWDKLGDWRDDVEKFDGGPVRWMERHWVFRDTHLLAAHVNDVTDEELEILARNDVTVVHCPRTHAYFGRSPFDLHRYVRAGVGVKLGTDSTASCGDLNLMADVRLLGGQNPGMSPEKLLGMAMEGKLVAGEEADVVAWPVASLGDWVSRAEVLPAASWVGGVRVGDAYPRQAGG